MQKSYCKISSKINYFDSFKNMKTSQNKQKILKKRRLCFVWNFCNNFWKTIYCKYNCDINMSILHTYAILLKTMNWNFFFDESIYVCLYDFDVEKNDYIIRIFKIDRWYKLKSILFWRFFYEKQRHMYCKRNDFFVEHWSRVERWNFWLQFEYRKLQW